MTDLLRVFATLDRVAEAGSCQSSEHEVNQCGLDERVIGNGFAEAMAELIEKWSQEY